VKQLTKFLLRRFGGAARPYLQSQGLLRTSKVFNTSALVWEPGAERVMVVAPHMDDETIGCGGALARHVKAGGSVHVVFLTDGRHGSSQLQRLTGEARRNAENKLVETRKQEAGRALAKLGVSSVTFLDVEDGTLVEDKSAASRLREVLQAQRPEIVYLPCYVEQHPDHFAANRVLLDAVRDSELKFQCMAFEVWTPLFPNCLVKIDDVVELKKSALSEYVSQLADQDYLHIAVGMNAYRSAGFAEHYGRYAEAYFALPIDDYRRMFAEYTGG
jgi:LmbE family N-acetylglucosaminyl deacetylase